MGYGMFYRHITLQVPLLRDLRSRSKVMVLTEKIQTWEKLLLTCPNRRSPRIASQLWLEKGGWKGGRERVFGNIDYTRFMRLIAGL